MATNKKWEELNKELRLDIKKLIAKHKKHYSSSIIKDTFNELIK